MAPASDHLVETSELPSFPLEAYLALGTIPIDPTKVPPRGTSMENPASFLPDGHPLKQPIIQLLKRDSWIHLVPTGGNSAAPTALKVYVLPEEEVRSDVRKGDQPSYRALKKILDAVDCSKAAWQEQKISSKRAEHYDAQLPRSDSLAYIFNTLESPRPHSSAIGDEQASSLVSEIISGKMGEGVLKTNLFAYQKRSVAMMLQREVQPRFRRDPRFDELQSPEGRTFYFDRHKYVLVRDPGLYEDCQGGILAEGMGLGKTLICLALVLATKDFLPQIPPQCVAAIRPPAPAQGPPKLSMMACTEIARNNFQWRHFFKKEATKGVHYGRCLALLETHFTNYAMADESPREIRRTEVSNTTVRKLVLSSTTLIIVPLNLVGHWEQQVKLHFVENGLSVFSATKSNENLPPVKELSRFDIVLISKARFVAELNHAIATINTTMDRPNALPIDGESPLLKIHFLRVIVDEGHDFVSSGRSAVRHKIGLVHSERKWIVSGTPSQGLIGLEIDNDGTEIDETSSESTDDHVSNGQHPKSQLALELERRDLAALGQMATVFLDMKPWSNRSHAYDAAGWDQYVVPKTNGTKKPVNLRAILEGIMVRHNPKDIELDVNLPPLYSRVVYLEPCFFDKISLNLFILVLTTNAVTSERTDKDYMFHKSNRLALDELVKNLRHCGFFWTGFKVSMVEAAIKSSQDYLDKPSNHPSSKDASLLENGIQMGRQALASNSWKGFVAKEEIGLFVKDCEENLRLSLSMCQPPLKDLFIGASQALGIQRLLSSRMYDDKPFQQLEPQGLLDTADKLGKLGPAPVLSSNHKVETSSAALTKNGLLDSSLSPTKRLNPSVLGYESRKFSGVDKSGRARAAKKPDSISKSALKDTSGRAPELPSAYEELAKPALIGTASAKLTYLIDRLIEFTPTEKVLIFYEAGNIAWYISQVLDVLNIEHRIYASGLSVDMRSEYLASFNDAEDIRVLLMDLRQGGHGLHVAKASRVFFINPVWAPSVEAQAIKRAHRIGQYRPVYVETLILQGTLEEQMWERRKAMTTQEQQKALRSPLDDATMYKTIQNADFIPFNPEEIDDEQRQMAALRVPQQFFCRDFAQRLAAWQQKHQDTDNQASAMGAELDGQPQENGVRQESGLLKKKRKVGIRFDDDGHNDGERRRIDVEGNITMADGAATRQLDNNDTAGKGAEANGQQEEMVSEHQAYPKKRKAMFLVEDEDSQTSSDGGATTVRFKAD